MQQQQPKINKKMSERGRRRKWKHDLCVRTHTHTHTWCECCSAKVWNGSIWPSNMRAIATACNKQAKKNNNMKTNNKLVCMVHTNRARAHTNACDFNLSKMVLMLLSVSFAIAVSLLFLFAFRFFYFHINFIYTCIRIWIAKSTSELSEIPRSFCVHFHPEWYQCYCHV